VLLVSEIFTQVLAFRGSSASDPSAASRRPLAFRVWLICFWAANACALALLLNGRGGWSALAFFAPAPWLAWQILNPRSSGIGPAVTRFETPRPEVWLTIDDGPDPLTTPHVLALLERAGARATFFLIGEKATRHPQLVQEIVHRGHRVANHTHTHTSFLVWCLTRARMESEIDRCAAALAQAGVTQEKYFRPPVGLKNLALHPSLAARGSRLVLWSARGFDTMTRNPRGCAARILRDVQPGAILLLHESGTNATRQLTVLDAVLSGLREKNYACIIPEPESLR
jgi:peptidoglycan-N-acetylglucosamine deacetylase